MMFGKQRLAAAIAATTGPSEPGIYEAKITKVKTKRSAKANREMVVLTYSTPDGGYLGSESLATEPDADGQDDFWSTRSMKRIAELYAIGEKPFEVNSVKELIRDLHGISCQVRIDIELDRAGRPRSSISDVFYRDGTPVNLELDNEENADLNKQDDSPDGDMEVVEV